MTTVGLVGLGLLDDAVATRLLAAGHAVVGYDVRKDPGLILDAGADVGASLPLTRAGSVALRGAAGNGHGEEDVAVVTKARDAWESA